MGRCAIMTLLYEYRLQKFATIQGTQADNQEEDVKNEMPPVR
jgi:hypothetical protein